MTDILNYTILLIKNVKPEINEINYDDVLANLILNSISLIELVNNNTTTYYDDFYQSVPFQIEYEKEKDRFNQWQDDFLEIKAKWDLEKIDYIFHKSFGDFPYLSGNLDILVREKDFKRAGEILVELNYINLRNIQEAHKEFYRKLDDGREFVPIHLHERVCWGVPFDEIKHIWKNYKISDTNPVVKYPCTEDAILLILSHHFLEDHLLSLFDLLIFQKCINVGNIDWEYIERTTKTHCWEHSFYTALIIFDYLNENIFGFNLVPRNLLEKSSKYVSQVKWIRKTLQKNILKKDLIMPFRIPHLWTRFHSSQRILKDETFGSKFDRFYIVITHLLDGFIHNKLKIKAHAPLFVVFCGIDGCGKSSHINTLLENHRICDIRSKAIWSRAGSLPGINKLLKIVHLFKGNSAKKEIKKQDYQKRKSLPKNQVTIHLWRLLNSWEMIFWYFFKIRIPLIFGKSIIADRYIYDSIIDMEILGNSAKYNRFIYKLLELLTPKPDVIFNLNVDLDNIISRGVDESRDELAIKEKHYKKFLSTKNIIEIDNNNDFNSVNSKLTAISLKKLFDKHPDKFKDYKVRSFRYK